MNIFCGKSGADPFSLTKTFSSLRLLLRFLSLLSNGSVPSAFCPDFTKGRNKKGKEFKGRYGFMSQVVHPLSFYFAWLNVMGSNILISVQCGRNLVFSEESSRKKLFMKSLPFQIINSTCTAWNKRHFVQIYEK